MFDITTPDRPTLAGDLPANTYHYLLHTLRKCVPSSPTDSLEDLARRDHALIACIAALQPANAAEADIAALYVAASEQAKDSLRLIQNPDASFYCIEKCRAQAASMMRQARGNLSLLLRMQATRRKTEADNEARDRAAWAEHCAAKLMTEALSEKPRPATITQPSDPQPTLEPADQSQPAANSATYPRTS
jgi:hypothetical protein